MLKKLLIALGMLSVASDSLSAISSDDTLSMIGSIHRRYYLIKRLEKPIHLLYGMQQQHKTVTRESARHSFDALWTDFLSYKYIDDDLFEREMIIATLLFYRNILDAGFLENAKELSARIDTYITTLRNGSDYISEPSLDALFKDIIHQPSIMQASTHTPLLHDILLGHSAWSDFYPDATYNVQSTVGTLVHVLDASTHERNRLVISNTLRLYHIQRMLKALFLLSYHAKMPIHLPSSLSKKITTPIVRDCVTRIEKTDSLLPLFQVWQRIICYDFIDDVDEIKEFMHVLIIVYKSITCCLHQARIPYAQESVPDTQLENVLAVYDHLSALEVAELLDLLDDVAVHLEHVIHLYELNNVDLSWAHWFKKYWWTLPLFATWFYVALLKHMGNNTYHKIV